jgi:pteridine reductase
MKLEGRVALVTGSAVRIGRALALALAREGARLVVHYNSSSGPAQETVTEIQDLGSEAWAVQADLSQFEQLAPLLERAVHHFGRIDILVNSAAIFEPARLSGTTESDWDRHFAINLKAPFFLSQAFAAHIATDQRAHIVNIADWRGLHPDTGSLAYSLTKSGLIAMTKGLALALAPRIQVNAIAPGAILPPPGEDQAYLQDLARTIPIQHPGSPDEVARALVYLLSSDFVTGEVLYVTGGQHLAPGER